MVSPGRLEVALQRLRLNYARTQSYSDSIVNYRSLGLPQYPSNQAYVWDPIDREGGAHRVATPFKLFESLLGRQCCNVKSRLVDATALINHVRRGLFVFFQEYSSTFWSAVDSASDDNLTTGARTSLLDSLSGKRM